MNSPEMPLRARIDQLAAELTHRQDAVLQLCDAEFALRAGFKEVLGMAPPSDGAERVALADFCLSLCAGFVPQLDLPTLRQLEARVRDHGTRLELAARKAELVPLLPQVAVPALGPRFDSFDRSSVLGELACVGDPPGDLQLATRPGRWFAYRFIKEGGFDDGTDEPDENEGPEWEAWCENNSADDIVFLVALHADFVAVGLDLMRTAKVAGQAVANGATAFFYDAAVADDDFVFHDALQEGDDTLGGHGFRLGLYGDGDYPVRATERDGQVVCVVLSGSLYPKTFAEMTTA